jgi:hypothetical protein
MTVVTALEDNESVDAIPDRVTDESEEDAILDLDDAGLINASQLILVEVLDKAVEADVDVTDSADDRLIER